MLIPERYVGKSVLKIEEAMEILNISRSHCYSIARMNLFPVIKLGHTIRIPTEPFFSWLNKKDE